MPEGAGQEERTESATPKRKEESRQKGQVAKSMELTSAFMFLVALVAIRFILPSIFSEMMEITKNSLSRISDAGCPTADSSIQNTSSRTQISFYHYGISVVIAMAKALAPFAMVMLVSALVINYAQVGFLMSGEAMSPKFERLNPIKGVSRLISKRTLVSFIQSLFKIIVVGYVLYITARNKKDMIMGLADMPIKTSVIEITGLMFSMGIRSAMLLFVLGGFDYAYQRWEYERGLRMTKQEIKEEMKQTEGNPLIKSRIRSIQREMAFRRMMQQIPGADVVITNPTHLAVALKYDREADSAPRICAKGARLMAERIKAIAREHNIPIIEDKPLAHVLYKLELDQQIPETLYKAVAEILARIYQLQQNGRY